MKMRAVLLIALLAAVLVPSAFAAVEWSTRLPSGNGGYTGIVLDPSNRSYSVGFFSPTLSGIIASHDANGTLLWNQSFTAGNRTRFSRVARDSAGRLIVTGDADYSYDPTFHLSLQEGILAGYDANGTLLWNTSFREMQNTLPLGLAVDGADSIYITGTAVSYGSGSIDFFMRKVYPNRTVAWDQRYGISGSSGQNWADVVTDASGNSYYHLPNYQNGQYVGTLVKLAPNGTELWNSSFPFSALNVPHVGGALAYTDAALYAASLRGDHAYEIAAVAENGTALGNASIAIQSTGNAFVSAAFAASSRGTLIVAGAWYNGTLPHTLFIDEWYSNLTLKSSQRLAAPNWFSWSWSLAARGNGGILAGQMNDTAALLGFNDAALFTDTTPPLVTIVSPANSTGSNASVLFDATANEPVNWTVSHPNGTLIATALPATIAFPDGPWCAYINATDSAGNRDSTLRCFTVDSTPPMLNVSAPTNGSVINATNVTIIANASEAVTYRYSLDGAANVTFVPPFVLAGLANGTHILEVWAIDSAGNANRTVIVFTVSAASVPALTGYTISVFSQLATTNSTVSFNPNATLASNATLSLNASAAMNWTISIRDSANAVVKSFIATNALGIVRAWNGNGTASYNNGTFVAAGLYSINITANSGAGTFNDSSRRFNVTTDADNDTTAPVVTIFSPTNTTLAASSVALDVVASENATFSYSLNNGTNTTFAPNATLSGLSNGFYQLTVWARDGAGNLGSATVFFTVSIPASPSPPASTGGGGGGGGSFTSTTSNAACIENWSCTDWSACSAGAQQRTCTDSARCGATSSKPHESIACSAIPGSGAESAICEPGALTCVGHLLARCSPDGIELTLITDCENGCNDGACLGASTRDASAGTPVTGLFLALGGWSNLWIGLLAAGVLLLIFLLGARRRKEEAAQPTSAAIAPRLRKARLQQAKL